MHKPKYDSLPSKMTLCRNGYYFMKLRGVVDQSCFNIFPTVLLSVFMHSCLTSEIKLLFVRKDF